MTDDDLLALLSELAGDEAAASHHGVLLGRASAAPATAVGAWPDEVLAELPDVQRPDELREVLAQAAERCVAALDEGTLTLAPLLPDDDVDLELRTAALGQWCQGFLVGVAAAGVNDFDKLPGDAPEFLRDVLAISQAVSEDAGESDEQAYAELVEYLRVGVQLLHDELADLQPPPTVQ